MEKPVVVLSHPMLAQMAGLFAETCQVERMWDYDRAAFLAGPGPGREARVIVHAGEMVLEPELLSAMPALGLIACVGTGYDGVDVPWCRARGIEVTHAPNLNAQDVADHALGLVIGAYRGLFEADRYLRRGGWEAGEKLKTRGSLTGKTLGVVGLGSIGQGVARRAEACAMKIAWWGPRDKAGAPWPRAANLMDLATVSDVLVVACRADESNRGLIDEGVINALGKRGCLVNVSRGQVVDEDALIAALKEGRLGSAGIDVYWTEPTPAERWADVPNIVLTPHSAGSAAETVVKLVGQAVENVRLYLAGEPLASPVDD